MPIRPHPHPRTGHPGHRVDVSRTIDGRVIRLSRTVYGWPARKVRELEDKLRADLRDMELGHKPQPGKDGRRPGVVTLQSLIDQYLAFSKIAHRGARAHVDQANALLRHFDGDTPASAITHDDVVKYMKWRRAQKSPRGTPIAPATVDKEIALLGRLYKHAFANGALNPTTTRNPAEYVKLARIPTRRDRILSADELLRLLAVLSPVHRAIVMVARFTGLRYHHVLDLTWEQIGDDGMIRPPAFRSDEALYLSTKRFGLPPIPDGLFDLVPSPDRRKGKIWWWRDRPLRVIRNAFRTGCELAKIDGLVFHDLRRTYLTHLRRLGADPYLTQLIAGHAVPREMAVHARYQVVSPQEILAVGRLIFESEEYKNAVAICAQLAQFRWDKRKALRLHGVTIQSAP